ncbi:hypothetical protein CAJAP_02434 [Camponotus japonicus]
MITYTPPTNQPHVHSCLIEVSQSPQKIIDPKPQSRSPFTFGLPRQTLDAKSARGKKEWADFTCRKKEDKKIRDRAKGAIFVCT